MVGKICERSGFWAKSERLRALWMVKVMSWQLEDVTLGAGLGKSEAERLGWGWQREEGSRLHWQKGKAHRKERSVIRSDDDVGGQARITTDEGRVLWGRWWGYADIWRMGGCEDFVSEWKEFVFDAFSYSEPVKRAYRSDVTGFRSFNNCTGKRVPNLLEAGNLRLS